MSASDEVFPPHSHSERIIEEQRRLKERVYRFIWDYLVEHEELPTLRQVSAGLGLAQDETQHYLRLLRAEQRLCRTTLKPTAYDAWWRETVRREQHWKVTPLIPLRRQLEKQLLLPWKRAWRTGERRLLVVLMWRRLLKIRHLLIPSPGG